MVYIYIYICSKREKTPPTAHPFFFSQSTFNKVAINGRPLNNGNIKYQGALPREKFDGRNDRPCGQISEAKNAWRWLYFP